MVMDLAGKIPEEVIEQIRTQSDIVDVISEYMQLTKRGRNWFGLCPFHGEQTPSFSVSTDKQIFHCFGCGAGGNAITFVMDKLGSTSKCMPARSPSFTTASGKEMPSISITKVMALPPAPQYFDL